MSRQCDCSFSSALASSLLPPLFFAPRSPRSFVLVKVLSLSPARTWRDKQCNPCFTLVSKKTARGNEGREMGGVGDLQ